MYEDVLTFWFEEIESTMWWVKSEAFDKQMTDRFSTLLSQAKQGELVGWRVQPRGRLAEIVVLDQFSRNIHRDTPNAFAQDGIALVLAQEAVNAKAFECLWEEEINFLLIPFMHSESKMVHEVACTLFEKHGSESSYQFELKHKVIVDRFGRYPHRNAILGRASTEEELAYLQEEGSSF